MISWWLKRDVIHTEASMHLDFHGDDIGIVHQRHEANEYVRSLEVMENALKN